MRTNKALATIKSTSAATKSPTGSFDAILSAPTVDRDNEVIDPYAFDPLPDHITIDVDHAMSVEKTVASGKPVYDENGMLWIKDARFASTALGQTVRTLVDEGHIKTMSVAYHPDPAFQTWAKGADGKNHLVKGELLNAGIVGIPSNREAVITATKAFGEEGERLAAELLSTTEPVIELEQHVGFRSRKSVVGSHEYKQDQLRQALRSVYSAADWVYPRATFDDSVVFDMGMSGVEKSYQTSYTIDDDGLVEFGEPQEVVLAEVIVPQKALNTNPATKDAADAASKSLAAVGMAKARAMIAQAELDISADKAPPRKDSDQ